MIIGDNRMDYVKMSEHDKLAREVSLRGRAILSDVFLFSKKRQEGLKKIQCELLIKLYEVIKEEVKAENEEGYSQETFGFDIECTDIQKLLRGKSIITWGYVEKIDSFIKSKHFDENPDFHQKIKRCFGMDYNKLLNLLNLELSIELLVTAYKERVQVNLYSRILFGIIDYFSTYKINSNFDTYKEMCNELDGVIDLYRQLDSKMKESFQKYLTNISTDNHWKLSDAEKRFIEICGSDDKKEREKFEKKCAGNEFYKRNIAIKLINKIEKMPYKYLKAFFELLGYYDSMETDDWMAMGDIVLRKSKKGDIIQKLMAMGNQNSDTIMHS